MVWWRVVRAQYLSNIVHIYKKKLTILKLKLTVNNLILKVTEIKFIYK